MSELSDQERSMTLLHLIKLQPSLLHPQTYNYLVIDRHTKPMIQDQTQK